MVDWLVAWGVTQAVGFAFKPILEDLAKDAAKDWAKDLLKGIPNQILEKFKLEDIEIAAGKALKEFIQLMQQELEDADLETEQIKQYTKPLKQFINNQSVKQILGEPFKPDCQVLDSQILANTWSELNLLALPHEFNWEKVTKRYLKKVKAIIGDSEKLRSILNLQYLEAIQNNTQATAGIIPDFDLRQYQEAIRERYVNLKLDSLDTSGYAYNELRLWRMFIAQNVRKVHQILPQIHELPKEHLRRLRETEQVEAEEIALEELEKYKRDYFEQPIRSVLDIVKQPQTYKKIVILGDPGSGKSTLLQYLALDWVEKTLDQLDKPGFVLPPIPLLIELRAYMRNFDDGHCKNFLEFFHQSPGAISHLNQHQLQAQLKAGNALVMFDGLDEVFDPGKRDDIITAIHRFTNEYSKVQVIVTSRVIGYKPQRLCDAQFRHFMLQDLDSAQIQDFIERWHELTFNDAADKVRKRERLQRGIETSKAIAELAGNPLLLTMMAILNRNQELPRDRAELYNQASRILLHQWDVERALVEDKRLDPKTIDYKDKQAMLRQVAYYMQTGDKGLAGNLISASDLEKILTDYLKTIEVSQAREAARVMINQLRTRNFMLCFLGADYYAFVHRTFLEYFCAWEYVWKFEKERSITIDELKNEVFGKNWQDETWHEVLLLISGMIEPKFVGEILEYLMVQDGEREKFINLFLAAKCLAEVRNRRHIKLTENKLLDTIKRLTQYGNVIDLYLKEDLDFFEKYVEHNNLIAEIRTTAITVVVTIWQDDFDILTWLKERATSDEDNNVRYVAVQELAARWKHDSDIKALLKERATFDEDDYVRYVAVEELALSWKHDPDIKALLQKSANDKCEEIREFTLLALVRSWKDDPDTVAILKEHAISDFISVQQTAVHELAQGWKHDPDTLPFLQQLATQDKGGHVRQIVVTEIAQGWKDNPEALRWLAEYTRFDHIFNHNSNVACEALRELARSFKDDTNTKAFLEKHATSNEDYSNLPTEAVRELAQGWKHDPNTFNFLKNIANKDGNSDVQIVAVRELSRGWKENPETVSFLKNRAKQADSRSVRFAAVQELAQNFKDDPDTKTFLIYCVNQDAHEYVRGAAVEELAQNFKDDPAMFEVFYNCVINDPFKDSHNRRLKYNPRYIALDVIIKQFPQHPQTLPLLRDRAENDPDEKVRELAENKLREWGVGM